MTHQKHRTLCAEGFVKRSRFYQELQAERKGFEQFKRRESRRKGVEFASERALLDWIMYHREAWRVRWRRRCSK